MSYLAVGERVTGLGPTLGPGTAAVAVDADPPAGAGPGDLVQLWTTDPPAEWATTQEPRRVLTAELRDVHDDVVTIACDGADAPLVAGGSFRLLTLPTEPSHERQFASLLRAADETMAAVPVRPESDLVGRTVGELEATIVAVRPADGAVEPIPSRSRTVAAGETLYVVARPEVLRRLDAAAGTPTSAPSRGS